LARIKPLPRSDVAAVLSRADKCRAAGESDVAESMCLDALELEPDNQAALVVLLLARTDLIDRGMSRGVERAREVLPRLTAAYDQAYYAGLICERQARYMLSQRGSRSGAIAWEWFQFALEHYEDASRIDPEKLEPVLRSNACTRLVAGNRYCAPRSSDLEEHGIE